MKISIITASKYQGGSSIIALDIAKGMAKKGHQVLFITSGEISENQTFEDYRTVTIGQKYRNPLFHYFNPRLLWKLKLAFKKENPDIIHVHNINLQTFSLYSLLFSHRYPMIWTLHDLWPLCITGWPSPPDCINLFQQCRGCPSWPSLMVKANKLIKETIFRFSKISVVCPSYWMASLLKMSNLCQQPIHINHNGIDPSIFSPVKRIGFQELSNLSDKKNILLFCGGKRLAGQLPAERKGWKYLLSALDILHSKNKEIHLLYVGDKIRFPNSFPFAYTIIEGAGRDEMKNYYSMSDIFVLPTLGDNSPLTILEAMICKVPVIASSVGGIPEIISHGETGILCEPRDAESLSAAIELLIENEKLKNDLVKNAYSSVLNNFSFTQMIDRYESIYLKAIDRFNSLHTRRFSCSAGKLF